MSFAGRTSPHSGSVSNVAWFVFVSLAAVPLVTFAAQESQPLTEFEQQLVDLPANTWFEASETRMEEVCAPSSFGVDGVMGCRAVIDAWGGGAYDSSRNQMLIWGGGHNDYWGNEVYAFDLRHGRWNRLTDPSPGEMVAEANTDPLPDGRPNSRHTYDGLQYLANEKRLFGQGGSISPGGGGTSVTWLFDPAEHTWEAMSKGEGPHDYSMSSGYDPKSGSVIVRATKSLWSYDPGNNEWERLAAFGSEPRWPRYEVGGGKRGAVDTRRQLFWSVGDNDYLVWDIGARKLVSGDWVTKGGGEYSNAKRVKNRPEQTLVSGGGKIHNARAPGFDYDSKADQFVAWKGGPAYVLDLESRTWHERSASGAPPEQARSGTFGRWRYLPRYNVFILVNGVDANVFFYKNTPGGP